MISFDDAKRIINSVEHSEKEASVVAISVELFGMLEESEAERFTDVKCDAELWKSRINTVDSMYKAQEKNMDALTAANDALLADYQKLKQENEELKSKLEFWTPKVKKEPKKQTEEERRAEGYMYTEKEETKQPTGKKRGRPRKQKEEKVEDYKSDLDSLNDSFGIHDFVANELLGGSER